MTEKEINSSNESSSSYSQILKSTSVMGGVAGVTLILGMIRTKFAAIFIGAFGVGLLNNFNTILGFMVVVSGLGIQSSGVRQVSIAFAKNDEVLLAKTVITIKRICWITGIFGAMVLFILSSKISQITFGSDQYRWEISAMALLIIFTNLSGGQTAILQGSRKIIELAKVQIISSIVGSLITIIFYFQMGLKGIIPGLVLSSFLQLLISWKFSKNVAVTKIFMTWKESFYEAKELFKFGIALMCSGLMVSIVAYATNIIINNQINIQAVGIYGAAFALSGMFVNFVLGAMGTDYYPRLSSLIDDTDAMNRLVNEQTEVAILLALPGLVATIVLAPWIVPLFYSNEFLPAVEMVQWLILGCFGRVISWPMGFILLAKGKSKLFFLTETISNTIHLGFVYVLVSFVGIKGVSIAFMICYLFYTPLIYFVTKNINNFNWNKLTLKYICISIIILLIEILISENFGLNFSLLINSILIIPSMLILSKQLISKLGRNHKLTKLLLKIPLMNKIA